MAKEQERRLVERTAVVILAAGHGTRMGRDDAAKVCLEIDGIPAINRIIATFKEQRFCKFLVVVGSRAQQVMETVSTDHPDVLFAFQSRQVGTGDAAKVAAQNLQALEHTDPVLLTMGDKFLEPAAIHLLIDGFLRMRADFALLTIPKTKRTEASGGRVLTDSEGQAVRIIEKPDLARQAIADQLRSYLGRKRSVTSSTIMGIISHHIADAKKQRAAVPELLDIVKKSGKVNKDVMARILARDKYNLSVDQRRYTAKQIERRCHGVNPSLYMSRADAFYYGVGLIDNDNAQKEYYFTDIVAHLANTTDQQGKRRFRVIPVATDDDSLIQGFNSPDELLGIQDYVRKSKAKASALAVLPVRPQLKRSQYCTVQEWLKKLEAGGPRLNRWLRATYGADTALHGAKRKDLATVLRCYGRRFGFNDKTVIARAPGRINLMGRHVDHRGGQNNFLAIHRETLVVAGLREDDCVVAVNTQPRRFRAQRFNIADLIGRFAWGDWLNFINSDWVRSILRSTAGDWGNYIKAAMLRLQHNYQDLKIFGLSVALSGDIPIAAGLSSSSSIVVAILQSAIALNRLNLEARQFVDLCGEGEWFVGSRGGAGDHAAIYLGQRGKIVNVGYLPFSVNRAIDAPEDFQVVIADSHLKATKSSTAKHAFNSRICSYNLGLELLKLRCPQLAERVDHLRDVNPERLACTVSDIYRFLLKVPQTMTRDDFRAMLPRAFGEMIEENFSTHSEPKRYNVRGVLLFGIAEVIRSRMCPSLLENKGVDKLGGLMRISHDGDRVSFSDQDRTYRRLKDSCTDSHLNRLIADLASEDPEKVLGAQLYMQPGAYGCSTHDIDQMVDIACSVPGVAGAQIAGAGLGGCIMILVSRECVDDLSKALVRKYYRPRGLKPAVIPCQTVEGASLAEF
jgi:N-acetylgalactosamine kinase